MRKVFSFWNLLLLLVVVCSVAYYKYVVVPEIARSPNELKSGPSMNYKLPPPDQQ